MLTNRGDFAGVTGEFTAVMKVSPILNARLRLHVPSTSSFFILFKNGFNTTLWCYFHVLSKRSKMPLTKTETLTVCVNKTYYEE